jgi:phosphoenolpyruvate-protein kinase (PTS system EI component)
MKAITLIGTCMLTLCFVAAGAGLAAEKGAGAPSAAKKETAAAPAKAPAEQEKQNYIQQMQNALDEVSKNIDQLKTKAQTATGDARAKIDSTIAMLKAQQAVAVKKLQDLRSTVGPAWNDMKAGMSKAVDDLRKAYDDASKHFK